MQTLQTSATDMPPAQALADIARSADAIHEEVTQRFAALLPAVVTRLMGDSEAAQEAIRQGGFVLNDSTVVMRLNEQTDQLEIFCDVGLPQPHALEASQRAALELNLCRSYPGIVFGMHPQSGRLVATTAVHMLLMADDDVCLNTLQHLVGVVKELQANRTFLIADEEPVTA